LDIPEVSLVAILDADKEGFLRSERALIQTMGRAARNINGHVILYGDRITNSMQRIYQWFMLFKCVILFCHYCLTVVEGVVMVGLHFVLCISISNDLPETNHKMYH
jgi:hypothetical protein